MKKTASALCMLLLLLAGMLQFSSLANANPTPIDFTATSQIDSPQNMTYTTGDIPLNVVVTGDASERNYTVAYQTIFLDTYSPDDTKVLGAYFADGSLKVYNSTLSLKRDGEYSLSVTISYAMFGVYHQVYFTVKTNQPTPTPAPTMAPSPTSPESEFSLFLPTVPLLVIAATVIGISLLVYFKKRRRNESP
jgi:hypothetical protein